MRFKKEEQLTRRRKLKMMGKNDLEILRQVKKFNRSLLHNVYQGYLILKNFSKAWFKKVNILQFVNLLKP